MNLGQTTLYNLDVLSIDGRTVPLSLYRGKVLVIVNVASRCGLTKQFLDLEKFYRGWRGRGVEVLGFPSNDFREQAPESDAEFLDFCQATYNVSFPLFSKVSVEGVAQHPLYRHLTASLGTTVLWNFQKFVVDRNGEPRQSFWPTLSVVDDTFCERVEKLL